MSPSMTALEFSRRGDALFRQLAARFPTADASRLALTQKLDESRYQHIRHAAAAYVSACLGHRAPLGEGELMNALLASRGKIPNYTSGGVLMPKREQSLEFSLLHKAVANAFRDYDIGPLVDVIDLPFNVRMVYGDADPRMSAQPFSSSKLHCDSWAGVPADAMVIVLPLFGDIDDITIEFGEMEPEREMSALRALDDYDQGADYRIVRRYDVKLAHGSLYIADTRLLHQTVRRKKGGVRLSIDFRFRRNDLEYRAAVPEITGPDAMGNCVDYRTWLGVGSESMLVFEETMEAAAASAGHPNASSPLFRGASRLVSLASLLG
jgi:hypothetical protein